MFDILLRSTPDAASSGELPAIQVPVSESRDAAKSQPAPPPVAAVSGSLDTPRDEQLPRVLVADDNAINRKLIAKMLTKMGFESEMAENGLEALNAVQESRFDVVLMDLQMPQMDGLEATRQIRTRGFLLPIIAITADAMPDDQTRCAAAGMNDYLSKPVRASALEAALNNAMRKTTA